MTNTTDSSLKRDIVTSVDIDRNSMCFLYIGSEENTFEDLEYQFKAGERKANLGEAANFILQLYELNNLLPDVLFIDIPADEDLLFQFWSNLKENMLLATIPIIYNELQLSDIQIKRLKYLPMVDDIVNLNSNEINFASKIMFLKQSKLHSYILSSKNKQEQKKINLSIVTSNVLKRSTDIFVASGALLLLSPIFILIALIIKCESRGSVFYTSLRAGRGFKTFKFYKFRSMVFNADIYVDKLAGSNQYIVDEKGPKFFKISNDPRVTKFGKLLRNTSIDELPQLLNILKGDMSLVGNRPLPIYEAISLTTNEFVERFTAPAGLTGLWQVNKRGKDNMSIEERINLDITYSQNHNFIYDLKILVKTPMAMFQKSNV